MSSLSRIVLISLALIGWAAADLPKKAPPNKYTRLWRDSPFTSKPPPKGPVETINPLVDYALIGVSPVASGYRVTLLNKKKPEARIIVESDRPNEGFSVVSVVRKPGDPLGTVVRMKSGSAIGTVAFDQGLLALAAPPPPKAGQQGALGQQGQPPGTDPRNPGSPNQGARQPRPRVVAPPAAPAANPSTPQPGQPASNHSRPERRGR